MVCTPETLVGLMGSFYFLGFGISSGILPPLADKFGRKYTYFFDVLTQTIAYLVIFFSKNIYLTIACYLVVGLCAGGRVAIGTTYMNEFLPLKNQNSATTMVNVHDSSVMILQALYYYFYPYWKPLHIGGLAFAGFIMVAIQIIPESPKFYYVRGDYDNCRKSL